MAPLFVTWVGASPGAQWIDIGCGTGILTAAVLENNTPSLVVGIDNSDTFLRTARAKVCNPRACLKLGDAQSIPEEDSTFDVAVSGLVLNFLTDREASVREMVRVTRPGGIVALYVWDYAAHMQIMRFFLDVAISLDPRAGDLDDNVKLLCRPAPLAALFQRAGLGDVELREIDIPTAFDSFDDYWKPFLGGTGLAPRYCLSLTDGAREQLRQALVQRLPTGPDGEILLAARAWAVKGRVPR